MKGLWNTVASSNQVMKQKRTVACRRTGRPIFNRAAYVECYTFYTQWRLRWATWRDFINPNQTSLKPVSLVVPCFIFISRSLSLSLLLQLCSFPLITVRSTEKAARTVNWLFELSTPWMKRKRERKRALKFSRKGESRGCNDSFFLRFRRRHSTINETLFLSDEQKRRCKRS